MHYCNTTYEVLFFWSGVVLGLDFGAILPQIGWLDVTEQSIRSHLGGRILYPGPV